MKISKHTDKTELVQSSTERATLETFELHASRTGISLSGQSNNVTLFWGKHALTNVHAGSFSSHLLANSTISVNELNVRHKMNVG